MDKRIWKPLAMTLAVSAASVSQAYADVDIDNDGLIEISTLQQLDLMRYDLAGTSLNGDSTGCPATGCNGYELVADLDFDTNGNGIADEGDQFWNGGEGWEAIGANRSEVFSILEGNNHTISNLYANGSGSYIGLFGFIRNADIRNLNIEDADLTGGRVGVLAALIGLSTVDRITVSGNLDGYSYSGMLAGHVQLSSVSNVQAKGTISSSSFFGGYTPLGGVAGESNQSSFTNVEFTGELIGNEVTTVGGIVGFSYRDTVITNALVTDSNLSARESVGGIIGDSFQKLTVTNALFIGNLSSGYSTSPIVGDLYNNGDDIDVTGSYWDSEVSGIYTSAYGEARTTSELQCPTIPGDTMCDASLYSDWDETIWSFGTQSDYPSLIIDSDRDGVSDVVDVDDDNDGLIEISTLTQLDLMRYDLAGTSINGDSTGCPATGCNGYELVADLDFDTNGNGIADEGDQFWNGGEGWEAIGANRSEVFSILEGNNHTISNLYANGSGSYIGLFGFIRNADIRNLNIEDADLTGGRVGVLAALIGLSTVDRITVSGNLDGYSYSGMLAGHVQLSSVSNVQAKGTISSSSFFGGYTPLGGVAGESNQSSFTNVEFTGELIGNEVTTVGGIVGFSYRDTVITNALVTDSNLSARESVGGIIGDSFQKLTVTNALFIGNLSSGYSTSPIVGDLYNNGDDIDVTGSYWDSEVSGIYTSAYGEARTTSELQCPTIPGDTMCDASLFSDWDETIWDFGTSSDYPVLR
ncbi:hypothetical protein [Thalassolituus maritimus]|uniref:Uncharacterized protein n=1 Tax=Thalassolituus maritimus TaxID=484498 RepID=A0ABP9ZZF2_9GAMM